MIRVLIVDDHPATRIGVSRIFGRGAPDIALEEAAGGREALERLRNEEGWSLVLLDLVLPGFSGFEFLHEIKRLRPELPVLIFSMHSDGPFVLRALQEGAAGYLTKDCVPEELIRGVRKVASGGSYVMPDLTALLIDRLQAPTGRPLHEQLSSRELEVMRLLASGISLREIGQQLCVSDSTVSTYRTRILRKLHLENNTQLIRYVMDQHLDNL